MSAHDEELERQIFAMMEYLGHYKYSVQPLYGPFVSYSQGQIYFDSPRNCLMCFKGDKLKKYKAKAKERRIFIKNTWSQLVTQCREKALHKWVNIELDNNLLFWCSYE